MDRVNILIRLRAALLNRRWRDQTFAQRGFGWQADTAFFSPTGSRILAQGNALGGMNRRTRRLKACIISTI